MPVQTLGMYIHTHWAYRHPYSARTWSLEDWRGYLAGLAALGCNLVQVWPLLDTMPAPPTASDRAFLDKLGQVIRLAHAQFGMKVYVGASANVRGNTQAARYAYEQRPYFVAEERINPAQAAEVRALLAARRALLAPLAEADGFWLLDSDPGGYPGSPPADFVRLARAHRQMLDELRPGIELVYWMWLGWLPWAGEAASLAALGEILDGLAALDLEPWRVLACRPGHFELLQARGLAGRALHFPYSAVEDEPSFPWTGCDPARIAQAVARPGLDWAGQGALANSQSHCLQLPHLYYFQHFIRGGTIETADLPGFADDLLPGFGAIVAAAWQALAGLEIPEIEQSAAALRRIKASRLRSGPLGGLLFGDPRRFLNDLIYQLAVKRAALLLRAALAAGQNVPEAFAALRAALRAWAAQTGYADWHYGPFRDLIHPLLEAVASRAPGGAALAAALAAFDEAGRNESVARHSAFTGVLAALDDLAL